MTVIPIGTHLQLHTLIVGSVVDDEIKRSMCKHIVARVWKKPISKKVKVDEEEAPSLKPKAKTKTLNQGKARRCLHMRDRLKFLRMNCLSQQTQTWNDTRIAGPLLYPHTSTPIPMHNQRILTRFRLRFSQCLLNLFMNPLRIHIPHTPTVPNPRWTTMDNCRVAERAALVPPGEAGGGEVGRG
ncbi:hypothetical protein M422DRAFT_249715 [Sphaerobolus stellatus SS14]|uniref:Uncharacterized protein n=1 Tax=Sphaerobolus stellatus (strain SS14) TaxID=990650 RepID=A0A0C9UU45_SPHS4|nr:hypothetical protein M422DRAFT_249715 [Sphaerobolus stellatus SS14]